MVQINFSKLYCEKLYDKNLLVLAFTRGATMTELDEKKTL